MSTFFLIFGTVFRNLYFFCNIFYPRLINSKVMQSLKTVDRIMFLKNSKKEKYFRFTFYQNYAIISIAIF